MFRRSAHTCTRVFVNYSLHDQLGHLQVYLTYNRTLCPVQLEDELSQLAHHADTARVTASAMRAQLGALRQICSPAATQQDADTGFAGSSGAAQTLQDQGVTQPDSTPALFRTAGRRTPSPPQVGPPPYA